MKGWIVVFSVWLGLGSGGVGLLAAEERATAKAALEALGRDRGEAFRANVVQVIGVGGADQPPVWRVIARDPYQAGAVRDFAIEGGRVVGDQFVPPAYHARVPTRAIGIEALVADSSAVFRVADATARRAKVGFDQLDYEARAGRDGVGVVWVVRLLATGRRMVGELVIDAGSGAVLKERWPVPPPAGAAEAGQGRFAAAGARPGLRDQVSERWEVAKTKFSEGTAVVKNNAKTAGASVGAWFRNVAEAATGGGASEAPEPGALPEASTGPAVVPRALPATYGYQRSGGADAGRYH